MLSLSCSLLHRNRILSCISNLRRKLTKLMRRLMRVLFKSFDDVTGMRRCKIRLFGRLQLFHVSTLFSDGLESWFSICRRADRSNREIYRRGKVGHRLDTQSNAKVPYSQNKHSTSLLKIPIVVLSWMISVPPTQKWKCNADDRAPLVGIWKCFR